MSNPIATPRCTFRWHGLHRGTCLRFILARFLSNLLNLGLMVLICFRWCISILSFVPQAVLAQHCPNGSIVEIFQLTTVNGSPLKSNSPRNLLGVLFRGGHRKFSWTVVPSFLRSRRVIFGPNLRNTSLIPERSTPICSWSLRSD